MSDYRGISRSLNTFEAEASEALAFSYEDFADE